MLPFSVIEKERKSSIRHNASYKQRNMQNARIIHWENISLCLLLNYFFDMFSVVYMGSLKNVAVYNPRKQNTFFLLSNTKYFRKTICLSSVYHQMSSRHGTQRWGDGEDWILRAGGGGGASSKTIHTFSINIEWWIKLFLKENL